MATTNITPAVWYARVIGAVLLLVGIVGFTMTTSIDNVESLLGFHINLTENIIHLSTGLIGVIAGFWMLTWAKPYALILGIVYLAVGIWGMFDRNPLELFGNLNDADNMLHLALGVVGLAAYAMSRERVRETTV